MSEVGIGDDVKVVSGPHEGRSGRVVYMRQVAIDGRGEEPYAIVEFMDTNGGVDHISVPARRTARK